MCLHSFDVLEICSKEVRVSGSWKETTRDGRAYFQSSPRRGGAAYHESNQPRREPPYPRFTRFADDEPSADTGTLNLSTCAQRLLTPSQVTKELHIRTSLRLVFSLAHFSPKHSPTNALLPHETTLLMRSTKVYQPPRHIRHESCRSQTNRTPAVVVHQPTQF